MVFKKQTHCKNGHLYTEDSVYWSTRKDGRQLRQCRECVNAQNRSYYQRLTPEERRDRRKKFPSTAKMKHYQRKYRLGISEAEYRELLIAQDGLCLICTTEGATHVDHDHDTKQIRGILCGPCNRALGLFREDIDALQSAIDYLKGAA